MLDCAIQDWVLRQSGIDVESISLAHVNNQFVYPGGGNYEGLLLENDLTEEGPQPRTACRRADRASA